MGGEVVVTNGKLDFGPWEQIFYGEFDGLSNDISVYVLTDFRNLINLVRR
jgi:thiamine phosphate synthase YjbQ (UPF0047 family)